MSSSTKTLPQLYEEEQTRNKLLQKKITRLEHYLDVAKDLQDRFEVQNEQLSTKYAALLDLQTAFDRVSSPVNDANVEELQKKVKLLEGKVAEAEHLFKQEMARGRINMKYYQATVLKNRTELSDSSRSYEEELGMQRRDLEEMFAVCRSIIEAQYKTFDIWQTVGSEDILGRSLGHSMSAVNKAENAMALMQRSPKPYTGDDRKAKTVQGSKPSSIPGNTPRVHPPTKSVQAKISPAEREMLRLKDRQSLHVPNTG